MLERLGLTDRRAIILMAAITLLVAITALGKEATHPLVLGIYRSLLLGIVVLYAWSERRTLPQISPYFLLALAAVVAVMALSVILRQGSHFEAFYAFYEKILFIAAFMALAHASPARSPQWKRTLLATVVLLQVAYLAGAILSPSRPLIGSFVNPNYFASFLLPGLAICVAAVSLESSL